ncbi:MAG: hypothetical protein ACI4XB_00195 [Ruminococcus sp.]
MEKGTNSERADHLRLSLPYLLESVKKKRIILWGIASKLRGLRGVFHGSEHCTGIFSYPVYYTIIMYPYERCRTPVDTAGQFWNGGRGIVSRVFARQKLRFRKVAQKRRSIFSKAYKIMWKMKKVLAKFG